MAPLCTRRASLSTKPAAAERTVEATVSAASVAQAVDRDAATARIAPTMVLGGKPLWSTVH